MRVETPERIMWNEWYYAIMQYDNTMLGDLPFIEFTVDASGYEIVAGTPKSDAYFQANWAIPSGKMDESFLPRYISSWEQIYHPDLIQRNAP